MWMIPNFVEYFVVVKYEHIRVCHDIYTFESNNFVFRRPNS
jgi:hypothetical protein